MAFRTTPQLGPALDTVYAVIPYWDEHLTRSTAANLVDPSYRLGNVERGSDGAEYTWVKTSAAVAATATTGTQVTVTTPAFTVATGTGGFYTPPGVAVASGSFVHVRRGAYNAVPG